MLFLSTYHNRIDKKGRISVPAPFRAALAGQEFSGIVANASFINPCIEGYGMDRIKKLNDRIEALDPFKRVTFDTKKFQVESAADVAPTAAVAVGLALRRVGDR